MANLVTRFFTREFMAGHQRSWSSRPKKNKSKAVALAATQKPVTEERQIRKDKIEVIRLLRDAPDVGNWRSGLMMAESLMTPDRRILYATYKENLLDAHLISVTSRIIFKCTNHRIRFYTDGKADNEAMNEICEKPWFYEIVKHIIESKWWGHSLIQCNFLEKNYDETQDGITLIPRQNVRPEFGDILKKPGNQKDVIKYRERPYHDFLLEVGKADDLGLFNVITPNVIYKRFGVKDWAEFLEVYGMPIKELQYDPNVSNADTAARQALQEQGSNAGVITPIGSTFKLHDSAKAGNSQAFDTKATFHNKEISKAFLLQTMTTEDGSSRSQGEVHEKAEQEAIAAYRLFVELILNYKLLPLLARHGYPVGKGKFMYDDRPRISKVAMADLLVKLQSIADIPQSWVYETFGIPAPTSADDIKDNPAARAQQPNIRRSEETLSLPERKATPRTLQLSLEQGALTSQEQQLLQAIYTDQQQTGSINRGYFQTLARQLENAVGEGMGSINTDFDAPDHLYQTLLETNVQRFAQAKTIALVQQLNELKNSVSSFTEFRLGAEGLLQDYNVNWLKAEYNHAVAAAQNGANYLRQLANKEDYPYWEYQTIGDDRVRASHSRLDERIFRIDDPEAARIYPPNGYGCRCEGIPTDSLNGKQLSRLEDAIGELGEDWDRMVEKGFAINFGEAGQVFDRSMEYIQSFNPGRYAWKAYGLQAFASMRNLDSVSEDSINATEWISSRRGANGLSSDNSIRLTDYRSRPILLEDNVVEDLGARNQSYLLSQVEQILNDPDEVWTQAGANLMQRQAIKFVQGGAVVLTITFGSGTAEAITSIGFVNLPDLIRSGILSYKK